MRVLLLAALPQEHGSLRRRSKTWRLLAKRPFRHFSRSVSGVEVLLVETGMGARKAGEAMKWACGWFRPDLALSIGFAGSLCGELKVGDVLLGEESVRFLQVRSSFLDQSFVLSIPEDLKEFFKGLGTCFGRIVTVEEPRPKAGMATLFSDLPTVVDMETHAAADFAAEAGVPLLCIRCVSDGLYDEIDYKMDVIADSEGNVRISKVMTALLMKPGLLNSFTRSWRRATVAADGLGRMLCGFLNLPASVLARGAAGCRVGIRGGACKG